MSAPRRGGAAPVHDDAAPGRFRPGGSELDDNPSKTSPPPSIADTTGQSDALLTAIVAAAMDAVVAVDGDQRIVLFNPAAELMFRCAAAAALGQPLDRFLPARFRSIHRRHVAAFGATGDTSRSMGHLRPLAALRADGGEFPIEATIARVAIGGQPYFAAIVRDISARQAAEATLRRHADMLDLAYDAIFTWDWHGAITFWNRGAERLYGYTREEAIGRLSHELLRTRHPEGRAAVLRTLERDGTWEGELIHVRRDGTEAIVESRHVLVREGMQTYVLEANRDATAHRRAEAERAAILAQEAAARAAAATAAAQRDQLHTILDGLPSGVYIATAPDGRIEFANGALVEMVFAGFAPAGALPVYGRDFALLRADGTPLPAAERPGLRALRGERMQNVQLLLERADGDRLPVAAHAAPLREGPEAPTRAVVVLQDVTQLRQAEQLKDDFLSLISHEFRTPLTAIHGGARLLANQGEDLDASTRRELLADVAAESDRLHRLLGNLMTLAAIMAGRLQPTTEPVLVPSLARAAAESVAARSPNHAFVIDVGTDLPPVEADPGLLEEVLSNLYENAVKYAPAGGEVRTTAARGDATVAIHIADQGIGIAPEHVEGVFERFRRPGAPPTVRGMGLGLYLSRLLVDAQGGRIAVASDGPGLGSTFTVTLPIAHGWTDAADG